MLCQKRIEGRPGNRCLLSARNLIHDPRRIAEHRAYTHVFVEDEEVLEVETSCPSCGDLDCSETICRDCHEAFMSCEVLECLDCRLHRIPLAKNQRCASCLREHAPW
jgi:ribosomal protein L32